MRCGSLIIGMAMLCIAQTAPPQVVDPFPHVVRQLRPSAVAIGSYHFSDAPTAAYFGSGFVVADGNLAVTNYHVIEMIDESKRLDHLRVFFPDDDQVQGRVAQVVASDKMHDLALLRFEGPPAPAMTLQAAEPMQGQAIGVLGYPMGMALGATPTVHKGVVAVVVDAVRPLPAGARMQPMLERILREPFKIYQLDLVVFPGHSGSPIFDAYSGQVLGVINKTLAAKTREHLIETPSGIAYAVPSQWVVKLIDELSRLSADDAPAHGGHTVAQAKEND